MTVKFAKRVAAELSRRGENAIKVNGNSLDEVGKAMTREDVRALLKSGALYVVKARRNVSMNAKELRIRRGKGRGRGRGKRRGTYEARQGERWQKQIRSQRMFLSRLKMTGKIDRATFKRYYMLVKGNSFPDKSSLLLHLGEDGIRLSEAEMKGINEYIREKHG